MRISKGGAGAGGMKDGQAAGGPPGGGGGTWRLSSLPPAGGHGASRPEGFGCSAASASLRRPSPWLEACAGVSKLAPQRHRKAVVHAALAHSLLLPPEQAGSLCRPDPCLMLVRTYVRMEVDAWLTPWIPWLPAGVAPGT